jgi:hypothetical protein
MISFFLFIVSVAILCFEGRCIVLLIAGKHCTKPEQWILGFPLGVAMNALLFFLCTVLALPLSASVIAALHAGVITLLLSYAVAHKKRAEQQHAILAFKEWNNGAMTVPCKIAIAILLLSIAIKLFYAITHAVLFPTFYFDAISQWTMRAKISYFDQAIAFDADELRGFSKPQYPILLHSLQIFVMLFQQGWRDSIANAGSLLLSLTSFFGFTLILLRLRGVFFAVLTLALLFMIPLVPEHLSQGYGDIHVIEYLLLSALFAYLFLQTFSRPLLTLSMLFCASAAWVKQDGLVFGVLPWIILMGVIAAIEPKRRRDIVSSMVMITLFAGAWSLFLLFKGMSMSPHSGDTVISWHPEGVPMALFTLFSAGSFGIYWYVVFVLLIVLGVVVRNAWRAFVPELFVVLWGLITLVETLFVFLCTPNVSYLLNSQTFSRTMMIPLFLLLFGLLLLGQRHNVWEIKNVDHP